MEKEDRNVKAVNRRREKVTGLKSSGTREWAVRSVNCCSGCSHDCRYCYARDMAVRYRQLKPEQWKEERIRWKDVTKRYGHIEGQLMFPSSHDITPHNLLACLIVLRKLLEAGNRVLVVSKPHLECISAICRAFEGHKEQILFRFTIGAMDKEILSFWEPNAPSYEERKEALKHAFQEGFETSVSAEPMLDSGHIEDLVNDLMPYVNNAIWIGLMNHLKRITMEDEAGKLELQKIRDGQTEDKIMAIYLRLRGNPNIKWKSHIKKIVGIPLAEKPGMDR
jgi:DNA repair photolyase